SSRKSRRWLGLRRSSPGGGAAKAALPWGALSHPLLEWPGGSKLLIFLLQAPGVIPAKAGILTKRNKIPAFAGVTRWVGSIQASYPFGEARWVGRYSGSRENANRTKHGRLRNPYARLSLFRGEARAADAGSDIL